MDKVSRKPGVYAWRLALISTPHNYLYSTPVQSVYIGLSSQISHCSLLLEWPALLIHKISFLSPDRSGKASINHPVFIMETPAKNLLIFMFLTFVLSLVLGLQMQFDFKSEHDKWADMAFRFIRRLDCDDQKLTGSNQCWHLLRVPKSSMNVYVSQAFENRKLQVQIPDGDLMHHSTGHYDGVLAIDPYPKANFGHLVLLFLVENAVHEEDCDDRKSSIYISGKLLNWLFHRVPNCMSLWEFGCCRDKTVHAIG